MNNKEKRLKVAKIIIFIVTLTMLVGTFAMSISLGSKNKQGKKEETKQVTEESLNKNKNGEKVSSDITPNLKKAIDDAKVQVKGNEVTGVVVISEKLNQIQADKVTEQLVKNLKEKYKDKDIKGKVIYKNDTISEVNSYKNVANSQNKNIPQSEIQISSGLTMMDRYVTVTLKTDKPQQYSVEILGKKLEYVAKRNYFDGLIEVSDEAKIRKGLKITPINTNNKAGNTNIQIKPSNAKNKK